MQKTIKRRLVEHMLANGNSFRYTDMIKWIVENTRSKKYDWRTDRGYYADNFHKKSGYMVNGGGDCMVYKCKKTGKWKAKLLTKTEQLDYIIANAVENLTLSVNMHTANKQYRLDKIKGAGSKSWEERDVIIWLWRDSLKKEQAKTKNKILRSFKNINKSLFKHKTA